MDLRRTREGFQALRQAIADQEERTSIQTLLSINQAFADQENQRFIQKKRLFDAVRSMLDMPQFVEQRTIYTELDDNRKFNLYLDQARYAVQSILGDDVISALDDAMEIDARDDAIMVDQSDTRFNERRARNFQREAARKAAREAVEAAREAAEAAREAAREAAEAAEAARNMDSFKKIFNDVRSEDCGWRIAPVLRLDKEGHAIYIDGIVADEKLEKGTQIEMPLYKKNVQNQDPNAPVNLGDQFFNYDTLSDFQLTYGFAYDKDGFELLPTIPTGCGIAMFSNEPPLETRIFEIEEGVYVVSPDEPNAKIVSGDIPTGDEEGKVIYYIQLTRDVEPNEEIVWDYGPEYARNYHDYWGNRKFKRGERVSALYVLDNKRYKARIVRKINKYTYEVEWLVDGTTSHVSVQNIDKIN